MERATILGIYDFIGYSLCRHMLDLGFEIDGIHQSGNIDDYFTEEKRLEIGRNANFSEISLQGWEAERAEGFLFVTLFESLQTRNGNEFIGCTSQKIRKSSFERAADSYHSTCIFCRGKHEF
ncbi:hypothetical protein [Mesobacillus boroniphilus]|uniref:hypothetical protein n=1 Tax=Mesobacillus boroniphilus TaxID=308892 RepID=UPI000556D214|nr:hypothetical protein [Mesobacillus boroniphilus]